MGTVMLGLALLGLIGLAFAGLVIPRFMRWVEPPRTEDVDSGSIEQQVYEKLYGRRSSNVSPTRPHEDAARDSHGDTDGNGDVRGHEDTSPVTHRPPVAKPILRSQRCGPAPPDNPATHGCSHTMTDQPPYPHVVVGYESNDRGEDAKLLGELIVKAAGGELEVLHVDDADPAEILRRMAERGDADLVVLGSTHRAAIGSLAPGASPRTSSAAPGAGF